MKTIWKFPLEITDQQTLEMPAGAALLCVQIQGGEPQLWALVDPTVRTERRKILTLGTGHPVPNDVKGYVGTYQVRGGALVFHVFEGSAR